MASPGFKEKQAPASSARGRRRWRKAVAGVMSTTPLVTPCRRSSVRIRCPMTSTGGGVAA